ncbi:MAG: DUF2891 domain-containing protein, partial [Actinomycetota bacterium]|nr:DUF2891 domain-containing protein [Actinomycetota bacterium]
MNPGLDAETADRLLATAVANIRRDYPVHWVHLIESADDLVPQRESHPIFAGSYDWHSCVHQTWLAVRMLRLFPGLPTRDTAHSALDTLVTKDNALVEARFFEGPHGAFWERPYGWAWLFALDAELRAWPEGSHWANALRPLTLAVRARWMAGIAKAPRPVRVGTHTNSAFAIGLTL